MVDIYTGSIGSDPGDRMALLVGDTIYFDANDGSTGDELWAHNTSNHSTWQVANIYGGSTGSDLGGSCNSSSPTPSISTLMGGVRVENFGLTIPPTTPPGSLLISRAVEVTPPGGLMQVLVGDTIYFDAGDTYGRELWAHDTSNRSTWRVTDIYSGSTGSSLDLDGSLCWRYAVLLC